jgi:hypothetical protein
LVLYSVDAGGVVGRKRASSQLDKLSQVIVLRSSTFSESDGGYGCAFATSRLELVPCRV